MTSLTEREPAPEMVYMVRVIKKDKLEEKLNGADNREEELARILSQQDDEVVNEIYDPDLSRAGVCRSNVGKYAFNPSTLDIISYNSSYGENDEINIEQRVQKYSGGVVSNFKQDSVKDFPIENGDYVLFKVF